MKHLNIHLLAFSVLLLSSCGNKNTEGEGNSSSVEQQEVNVYSQRHYDTDDSLFALFTRKTGIKVNLVNAKADELINRMELEGKNSPADVFITVDAERLFRAKDKGLLQPIESAVLKQNIRPEFCDSASYWYAMTYRARILVYDKEKVKASDLSDYAALANPKWKGKILVRSSESGYNQALLSSIIANSNKDEAKKWAAAVVSNMARDPKGNDRDQVKALGAGVGEIAIINSYYLALMSASSNEAERQVANKVGIFFPNQSEQGTHINISGMALTAHAPHKDNAVKLLEFLSSPEAQEYITNNNGEYPVSFGTKSSALLQSWGEFKADIDALPLLEKHHNEAMLIFNEVGWK